MKKSSTEKLNEALGIESIDEMLNSLALDTPNEIKEINSEIKNAVDESIVKVDEQIDNYNAGKEISLVSMEKSLMEISELISVSKMIIQKVYENVATSDFVDSELVASASSLIKTTQESVQVYIDLYKERKRFYNEIAMEMLKQKNRLELLQRKHEYKMIEQGKGNKTEDSIDEKIEFSQAAIMKALQEMSSTTD